MTGNWNKVRHVHNTKVLHVELSKKYSNMTMPNIFTSDDVTFKVNIVFILIFSLALIFNSNSKRAGI